MGEILTITILIISFLAFMKGKEIFLEKKLIYNGGKKSNAWGILKEHFSEFGESPEKVFLDNNELTCHFSDAQNNFLIIFVIKTTGSTKDSCKVTYYIKDNDLALWKSSTNSTYEQGSNESENAHIALSYEYVVKKINLGNFISKTMSEIRDNGKKEMARKLKRSYKKMGGKFTSL